MPCAACGNLTNDLKVLMEGIRPCCGSCYSSLAGPSLTETSEVALCLRVRKRDVDRAAIRLRRMREDMKIATHLRACDLEQHARLFEGGPP